MTETTEQTPVRCKRCDRVLVDEDEVGAYYQMPVEDPEVPGLIFNDRIYECDGQQHEKDRQFWWKAEPDGGTGEH